MSRYIDADKAKEKLGVVRGAYSCFLEEDRPYYDVLSETIKMINEMPTADVVEADKAQKEIDYWHDKAQSYEQTILKLSLNKAEDAVEVVRCKDCKKREHCRTTNTWAVAPSDDWFCADGERA